MDEDVVRCRLLIINLPPVTAKQRVVKFQEMSLNKGQMAVKGRTLRKGRF